MNTVITPAGEVPAKSEIAIPADAEFRAVDAHIRQSCADTMEAAALYPVEPCPPATGGAMRVQQDGFADFIRSQGITPTDGDLVALIVIGKAFEAGATLEAATILELINRFNPARGETLAA